MAVAKYLTEFIGTFFLVLTIGLVVTQTGDQGAIVNALAIGSALMIMVYMGGHVSGGHYNPAVTLAATMRGACKIADVIPYWIAQVGGAIAAAVVVSIIVPAGVADAAASGTADVVAATPNFFGPAPGEGHSVTSPGPWLVEILFTFALALVVLQTATSSGTSGNSFYGLAIGFTVVVGAYAGGGISGGAFNPAVGIGPNLIKGTMGGDPSAMGNFLLHIAGPMAGGALAAIVFKLQEAYVVSQKEND